MRGAGSTGCSIAGYRCTAWFSLAIQTASKDSLAGMCGQSRSREL